MNEFLRKLVQDNKLKFMSQTMEILWKFVMSGRSSHHFLLDFINFATFWTANIWYFDNFFHRGIILCLEWKYEGCKYVSAFCFPDCCKVFSNHFTRSCNWRILHRINLVRHNSWQVCPKGVAEMPINKLVSLKCPEMFYPRNISSVKLCHRNVPDPKFLTLFFLKIDFNVGQNLDLIISQWKQNWNLLLLKIDDYHFKLEFMHFLN